MSPQPLGLFIQPACLQHRYIRHSNSSHIFERPERLRAVLLGVAAAIARIEELDAALGSGNNGLPSQSSLPSLPSGLTDNSDLSSLLSSLSIASAASSSFVSPQHLDIVPPPAAPRVPGQILQHHPALQLAHSPPPDEGIYEGRSTASSTYLRDLLKWATDAVENIKETGCEIPSGLGLNQGDLYLGPGSVLAIEGAVRGATKKVTQAEVRSKRCVRRSIKSAMRYRPRWTPVCRLRRLSQAKAARATTLPRMRRASSTRLSVRSDRLDIIVERTSHLGELPSLLNLEG